MSLKYALADKLKRMVPLCKPQWRAWRKEIKERLFYLRVKNRVVPFVFNGKKYRYLAHRYNHTSHNERSVELPIALDYLKRHQGKQILEIGNVIGHYIDISHPVIDKYEKWPGVLNVDIADFTPSCKYDLIISISTFEHIGCDENRYAKNGDFNADQRALLSAIKHTQSLVAPGGVFLMIAPLGYNPFFDHQISGNGLGMTNIWFLKRVSKNNHWQQVPYEEVQGIRYSAPDYPWANGLVVAEYVRPLGAPNLQASQNDPVV
jgi:hypothetical protein